MDSERPDIPAFFNSLREGMVQNANIKTIYGEPIASGNKTVIPVGHFSLGIRRWHRARWQAHTGRARE